MSCPHLKVLPISKRRICHNPDIPFKLCADGDCPLGLGSGTPVCHSCDPYQAASATRLLEGFFLGALEQTPGPDYE